MDHQCGCNCAHSANKSVCQTLSEMDWERGLWNAAFNGEIDRVEHLINKARNPKEAVNAPDNSGYTALHYAARKGHVDVCKMLLMNGADVNANTKSGKATPLHKAAAAGKVAAVKILIQAGADIKMQDVDGETALHKAAANKNMEVFQLLLEICPHLAQVEDSKGETAVCPSARI
ncbi:ankyrin repeat domain-containing protein 39 [Pectinophora gossypiella]|uniref:ankyrin repeat domain-containing protein 39 n=1 Tax=Pectinophora gossypiella TaxID=13191 RepID=UPI00214F00A4|nr:ankyrin repeat domain-containing protein 39 [Pectinophora gossypiella]